MTAPAERRRMTAAEYLAWEREQETKHEFHDGEIFAMSGGTRRHNFLSASVITALNVAFRGKRCWVFSSDQRVEIPGANRYVYPDAVVQCGTERAPEAPNDVLTHPNVVVEVLSASTERYNRGLKWDLYQKIPSLTDYLLVSQTEARIEHYERQADGAWRYRSVVAGDAITLSLGARIEVNAIYEGAFELEGDPVPVLPEDDRALR